MTKHEGFICSDHAGAKGARRSDAQTQTQTRLEREQNEDHDSALPDITAPQLEGEFDAPVDCNQVGSGISSRYARCAGGSQGFSRDELETDGHKREIALNSIGQLSFDDLLDGPF